MKKHILCSLTLIMAPAFAFAQSDAADNWDKLSGTRIDYFNSNGQRVSSSYVNQDSPFFQAYGNPASGFAVYGQSQQSPFCSFTLEPYGRDSYPLEVSAESADVSFSVSKLTDTNGDGKIDYDDIDFSVSRKAAPTKSAPEKAEIKCGDYVLFTIDLPSGRYPGFSYCEEYTMTLSGEPYYYDYDVPIVSVIKNPGSFPSFYFNWQMYPEYRDKDFYLGTGAFVENPDIKGRWYFLFRMPNGPTDVKFNSVALDDTMLSHAVGSASRSVYMARDYGNVSPFFNGEPWTMLQCGNAMSQDAFSNIGFASGPTIVSPELFGNAGYWMTFAPWSYYTGMIDMANFYLQNLERFTQASDSEKNKAQGVMRILRANSYLRLMQIYGPRWEDSNNGETPVAPLLTEWGNLELPAASMRELRDFCKSELESAINLLGNTSFDNKIIPDTDVARGLLVRLSMLCHDWATANTQSAILLDKFPLTGNGDMKAGFFTPADSWIWTAPEKDYYDPDNIIIGYNSFQSSAAVNGAYPLFWNVGSYTGCIDRKLFLSIPKGDIRREMFVMPESMILPPPLSVSSFYSAEYIDASNMAFGANSNLNKISRAVLDKNKPAAVEKSISDVSTVLNVFFGSQFKFWGSKSGTFSTDDNVCLMRADEILISRAEALYELGDQAGAIAAITKLNSMRNPGYKCSATGDALREEIRLTRRIELWGEGHSFFDFKRWNIPMERKAWVAGDTDSGNWPAAAACFYKPSDLNGWRFLVPRSAFQTNSNLDISGYGYTNPAGYEAPTNEVAPALRAVTPKKDKHVGEGKAGLTMVRKR